MILVDKAIIFSLDQSEDNIPNNFQIKDNLSEMAAYSYWLY